MRKKRIKNRGKGEEGERGGGGEVRREICVERELFFFFFSES